MKLIQNIRIKMFLTVLTVNVAALLLLSFIFYNQLTASYEQSYAQSVYDRVLMGNKSMDTGFQEVYTIVKETAYSDDMKQVLKQTDMDSQDIASAILQSAKAGNNLIDSMYCYIPETGTLIRSSDFEKAQELDEQTAIRIKQALDKQTGTRPYFCYDIMKLEQQPIFLYSSKVLNESGEVLAYVIASINERSIFYTYLEDMVHTSGENVIFLVDEKDKVVSISNPAPEFSTEARRLVKSADHIERNIAVAGKQYFGVWSQMPFSGLRLGIVVDKESVGGGMLGMELLYVLLALLVFILSAQFLYMSVTKLNRPIEQLAAIMRRIGEGNFDLRANTEAQDEIGYLGRVFNRMIEQINGLIDNLANERAMKRELRLKALQYQIRPHFIYNTLTSIRFAAMMQGANGIGKVLGDFIAILQATTNRNGSFTTVENEINVLKNYVGVQEFRLMNTFSVEYRIDPATNKYIVPRLILQPLLENSILHAPSEEKKYCRILVETRQDQDSLVMEIRDDGKGLSADAIAKLKNGTDEKTHGGMSGIGVKNIQERLRLYYGDRGSLVYESDGQSYTIARITLPLSLDENEYSL